MRAIIYIRPALQPEKERNEPHWLDNQEERCRELCRQAKIKVWSIEEEASPLTSRPWVHRRALVKALKQASQANYGLVVYSLCRLGRSIKDVLAITNRIRLGGGELITVAENIDTRTDDFLVVLTECQERFEIEIGRARAMGDLYSDRCPFGWKEDADVPGLLRKDQYEQEVIGLVLELHRQGKTLVAICRSLEADGVECRGRPRWYHTTVAAILRRAGKR